MSARFSPPNEYLLEFRVNDAVESTNDSKINATDKIMYQRCFELTQIAVLCVDAVVIQNDFNHFDHENFNMLRNTESVSWAETNSLDGLYIKKVVRYDMMSICYRILAYLGPEDKTFWRLKFKDSDAAIY
jgi:hypothetical protein